jgi:hypothetical protein
MTAWKALPPELAEIKTRLDALDERFETPAEQPDDVRDWHALSLRYTEIAARLGICNRPGCLNPKQPDAPWCVREAELAREILAEIRAEEARTN